MFFEQKFDGQTQQLPPGYAPTAKYQKEFPGTTVPEVKYCCTTLNCDVVYALAPVGVVVPLLALNPEPPITVYLVFEKAIGNETTAPDEVAPL